MATILDLRRVEYPPEGVQECCPVVVASPGVADDYQRGPDRGKKIKRENIKVIKVISKDIK